MIREGGGGWAPDAPPRAQPVVISNPSRSPFSRQAARRALDGLRPGPPVVILAVHGLHLVRQRADERRRLVSDTIGIVATGPPVLDFRYCNDATPRSSKRSKAGGCVSDMAEERAEGAERTGGSLRAPDLYWKELQQLKAACICMRLYRNQLGRRGRAIEITKAVASRPHVRLRRG